MKATEEHLQFLDRLRSSGVVNMFGARPHLQQEFGLDKNEAALVLKDWRETFSQRMKDGKVAD